MARFKKDKSSFLPDDDDDVDVDDIEVDLKNQVMNIPTEKMAERPSDFSLPGFLDDKDDPMAQLKKLNNNNELIDDD